MKKNLVLIIFNIVSFIVFSWIIIWSKNELIDLYHYSSSSLEAKKPLMILLMGFGFTGILIQFSFVCKKIFN